MNKRRLTKTDKAALANVEQIQALEREQGKVFIQDLDLFAPYSWGGAAPEWINREVERRFLKGESLFDGQTSAEDYVHRAFYEAWRNLSSRGFQPTPATHDLTDGFLRTALEVSGSKSRVDQVVKDWAKAVPEVQRFEALND